MYYPRKKQLATPEKKGWEWPAESSNGEKLHIFILSEDRLKKYNPQEIVKKQLFEKSVGIGISELKSKNWEFEFE